MKKVLVTGGAGFIGSHTVDALLDSGYAVLVYDNLDPQVHSCKPDYLNPEAEFLQADVRDTQKLERALREVNIVCHLASVVGVGQSMYEIRRYIDTNVMGTANLLELVMSRKMNIEKLVVASSMSVYGEGQYYCGHCKQDKYPQIRAQKQMEQKNWDLNCPDCRGVLQPVPVSESKPLQNSSIYAITKKTQEEMCLNIGQAYGIPTVALRYFNVYGSRQSLSNPYTGVCAIFSSRIKNNHAPLIFEDGGQSRDFIHVSDIARANLLAIEKECVAPEVVNVGTGQPRTIAEIADMLIELYGKKGKLEPALTNKYRAGDIRHCFADVTRTKEVLGFQPKVDFKEGMAELVEWGDRENAVDGFDKAYEELKERHLVEGDWS